MATATRLTLEEFLARPDIDERRLELIDGEVCEKASLTWGHGAIAIELGIALRPFGFAAAEPRAVVPPSGHRDGSSPIPDFAFYLDDPPPPDDWMRRPPDIAVEVRSPGQRRAELRAKVDLYRAFGVASIWLVDPERLEIEVFEHGTRQLLGLDDTITTTIVPGFSLGVRDLFLRARVITE
jgi:Uma2 family endonuclease